MCGQIAARSSLSCLETLLHEKSGLLQTVYDLSIYHSLFFVSFLFTYCVIFSLSFILLVKRITSFLIFFFFRLVSFYLSLLIICFCQFLCSHAFYFLVRVFFLMFLLENLLASPIPNTESTIIPKLSLCVLRKR